MIDDSQLRERAEQRIQRPPANTAKLSAAEVARLVYELEVHQEELEIQNEELRRAQVDLKTSRDNYADLYDFAPVGYLTLNAKSEIAQANLTACHMLNQERSRLIGKPLMLLCEVGSRADLRAHLDEVFATGNRLSTELQFVAETELYVHLESCRSRSPDEHDRVCRTVITDITARKQAETLALERDRHLRSIAESLPVLISYLDADLRYQFSNGAHYEWFGRHPEAMQGCTIYDVLGENLSEDISDYLTDALDGCEVTFECQLIHQKRGLRYVQVMLVPDLGAGRKVLGVHTLGLDVTERKIVEQQHAWRQAMTAKLDRLTADETNAYELMIRGKANKVIAHELGIGMRTAERRRQMILQKLEVESVAELVQELANIQRISRPVSPDTSG